MPNKVASGVLSHSSPCDVPQGYASVAEFLAALLDNLVGHLFRTMGNLRPCSTTLLGIGSRLWENTALLKSPFEHHHSAIAWKTI